MVDIENQEGGGIPAAERIRRRWWEQYGVNHWVVETNLLGSFSQYKEIREFTSSREFFIEDHYTNVKNEASEAYGVTALSPLFRNKQIVLPYGDNESIEKTDVLAKQLILWDGTSNGEDPSKDHGRLKVSAGYIAKVQSAVSDSYRARVDLVGSIWEDE